MGVQDRKSAVSVSSVTCILKKCVLGEIYIFTWHVYLIFNTKKNSLCSVVTKPYYSES